MKKIAKKFFRELKNISLTPKRSKYFVLMCQERTGSTLFSDLMSFHFKIMMDIHYFYTIETWPTKYKEGRIFFTRKPVRGYKFKIVHVPLENSPEEANGKLKNLSRRIDIIRLVRRNKLRQALSASTSGALTGKNRKHHIWKSDGESKARNDTKVAIDVNKIMKDIEYYTHLTEFEDRALEGIPHLSFEYESDLLPQDKHQSTANRAFEYLGLQPAEVETRLKRVSKPNISEYVANYDELVEELKNSPYVDYLPEHTA